MVVKDKRRDKLHPAHLRPPRPAHPGGVRGAGRLIGLLVILVGVGARVVVAGFPIWWARTWKASSGQIPRTARVYFMSDPCRRTCARRTCFSSAHSPSFWHASPRCKSAVRAALAAPAESLAERLKLRHVTSNDTVSRAWIGEGLRPRRRAPCTVLRGASILGKARAHRSSAHRLPARPRCSTSRRLGLSDCHAHGWA